MRSVFLKQKIIHWVGFFCFSFLKTKKTLEFWTNQLSSKERAFSVVAEVEEIVEKIVTKGKIIKPRKKIIGYALCNGFVVSSFAVLEEYRKKGIGKLIIQRVLKMRKDLDIPVVTRSVFYF